MDDQGTQYSSSQCTLRYENSIHNNTPTHIAFYEYTYTCIHLPIEAAFSELVISLPLGTTKCWQETGTTIPTATCVHVQAYFHNKHTLEENKRMQLTTLCVLLTQEKGMRSYIHV